MEGRAASNGIYGVVVVSRKLAPSPLMIWADARTLFDDQHGVC